MKKFNLLLLGAILASVGYNQAASNLRFGANALKQSAHSLFRQSGQTFARGRGFSTTPTFSKKATPLNPLSPNKLNHQTLSRFYSKSTNQAVKPGYFTTYLNQLKNSPSIQRMSNLFRKNQAPIINTIGLGLTGTTIGLGLTDGGASTTAYNTLVQKQITAQKKIENFFNQIKLDKGRNLDLTFEEWQKLGWSLFGEKDLTEEDKKRFALASAAFFNVYKRNLNEMLKSNPRELVQAPFIVIEVLIPLINLASGGPYKLHEWGTLRPDSTFNDPNYPGPEHIDVQKGFYIPTALVEALKSQDNIADTLNKYKKKLLNPELRKTNDIAVLPPSVGDPGKIETDSRIIQKRIALIDALIDLIEKPIHTYKEESGLIRYQNNSSQKSPTSSWIPWHLLGY